MTLTNIDLETNLENETAEKEAKDFLDSLEPGDGLKISVTRTGPDWMPGGLGWLKTFEFNQPGTSFNLETISKLYGGGNYKLQLIGQKGRYIKSASVAVAGWPKLNGHTVTDPTLNAFQGGFNQTQQQQQTPNTTSSLNEELLKMLLNQTSQQTKDQLGLLTSLLKQPQQQAAPIAGNTLGDITKMVEFVDTIRGGAAPQTDETGTMISGLMQVLGQVMANKTQPAPAQQQRQPRHFHAAAPRPQLPPRLNVLPNPAPISRPKPQQEQTDETEQTEQPESISESNGFDEQKQTAFTMADDFEEESLDDLGDEIAEMPIEDIGYLLKVVMEKMPQEKVKSLIDMAGLLNG